MRRSAPCSGASKPCIGIDPSPNRAKYVRLPASVRARPVCGSRSPIAAAAAAEPAAAVAEPPAVLVSVSGEAGSGAAAAATSRVRPPTVTARPAKRRSTHRSKAAVSEGRSARKGRQASGAATYFTCHARAISTPSALKRRHSVNASVRPILRRVASTRTSSLGEQPAT